MKTVRFVSKNRSEFAATLRKNVYAYFKENNIPVTDNGEMVLQAVVLFLVYITPFILILTVPMSMFSMLVLSVITGAGMSGTAMCAMHGAAHGSFSDKPWLNKLFSASMFALGGNPFTWKVQHNIMHHTFTNIHGLDEDIRSRAFIRLSRYSPIFSVNRYQHLYAFFLYGLMTLSQITKDFWQVREYNRTGITKQQQRNPAGEYVKLFVTKAIYLLIVIGLPILLTDFSWWQVLIGFFVMHFTAGLIMSIIFQMAHIVEGVDQPLPDPEGNIDNEWVIHQLYTTADFARNNTVLNWLIGGLNFQIEHHLFPNICHVHYPAIAPIVERTAHEFGLPYIAKPTFINAIGSHLRTLKELGRTGPAELA